MKITGTICLLLFATSAIAQSESPNNPFNLLIDKSWKADRRKASNVDIQPDSVYKFLNCDITTTDNLIIIEKGNRLNKCRWTRNRMSPIGKISIEFYPGKIEFFDYIYQSSQENRIIFRTTRQLNRPPSRFDTIITLTK